MSTNWEDADVHCPFYRECDGRNIRCEGIWRGTRNTITFPGHHVRLNHMRKLCMSSYTRCALYRLIEKKYEE